MIRNFGGPNARWGGWGSINNNPKPSIVPTSGASPFGNGLPDPATSALGGGNTNYTDMILRYLAQQLGLSNALGGR